MKNILYPIILIIIIILFSIVTNDIAHHNPFPPNSVKEVTWALIFILMWTMILTSLLWLLYGLVNIKSPHLIKSLQEKRKKNTDVSITNELFEFYKSLETNPRRYNQLIYQKHNNKLTLKLKFNLFPFIFPVVWLARLKLISPVFIFWIVSFIGSIIYVVFNNYNYNLIETSLKIAGTLTFVFVLILRFFLLLFGDSIEVMSLIKRMTPYFVLYKSTGNFPDDFNAEIGRSWFNVFIIWLIYYSSLIPIIMAII